MDGETNFILGDYVSREETLDTEYKEFCFKNNSFMKIRDFDDFFGLEHQQSMEKNLEYYFKNIIPKYISCFGNTEELKGRRSNIWIGISDEGEITGIPTLFSFDRRYISSLMVNFVFKNIRVRDSSSGLIYDENEKKRILRNTVRCSVYECEIMDDFLTDEFMKEKQKYDELELINKGKIDRYLRVKKEWTRSISEFCKKMNIVSNNVQFRSQICDYILQNCENEHKMDFIHRLRDSEEFVTPITPIFKILKNDPNNIYYWIVEWKDIQIQNLTKYRPVPPVLERGPCLNTFRSRITYHRKRWTQNNPNLKYNIIHIDFQLKNDNDYIFEFYDHKSKTWSAMVRDMGNLGPYSKLLN
jgi:hypothetical protein